MDVPLLMIVSYICGGVVGYFIGKAVGYKEFQKMWDEWK